MQNTLWLNGFHPVNTSTLDANTTCEVCIIGGGLSGIYTAYLLAQKGVDVIVLEAQPTLALGATAHSTGKLTMQHGPIFSTIPVDNAKDYYTANKNAIEAALEHANSSLFSRVTSYLYATTEKGKTLLQNELEAYKKIGINAEVTTETELSFPLQLALGIQKEAQINPAAFLNHFAKLALQAGARIYTESRVTKIINSNKSAIANKYEIGFQKLILCTHYPIESIKGLYSAKLSTHRAYLTAVKTSELLHGQYLSVDTESRTIRTALVNNTPFFIYGGSGHLAGTVSNTKKYYDTLAQELKNIFDLPSPEFCWSAQDISTPDQIPYVGPLTKNESTIYLATGYHKWGLSNALVAAEILSEAIQGNTHPASNLYTPSRNQFPQALYKMLVSIGFIGEQFIGGHIKRRKAPKCTHLGCKTRWNEGDETWDCPCHGSRFSKDGAVIEGPAVYPLNLNEADT
ncbi:FAD-dependent oxidoreductase [Lysinibacillus sp. 54212]|uniref:FAD-dependent oxidoreductase n=1 Tax=Lysinibacillus sp. 54212 TaxID=3119829 RepID=UPI002FCB904E